MLNKQKMLVKTNKNINRRMWAS